MDSVAPLVVTIVFYQESAETSTSFLSLGRILRGDDQLALNLTVLIYDNSPQPQVVPALPCTVVYQHDPMNGGPARGYNFGLQRARQLHVEWLLLLDQDTEVSTEYFRELREACGTVPATIVGIIPRLAQGGVVQSPRYLPRLSHGLLPQELSGKVTNRITAFNSGAAIRTSALEAFPEEFWLDFLDHAVFHLLQSRPDRFVWLLRSALEHQLSSNDLPSMPRWRFRNILCAERDFHLRYGSVSDRAWYHLRRARQTLGLLAKRRPLWFVLWSARAAAGLLPATTKLKR